MSYYDMNGLGGWMPTGSDVAKATQGAVGIVAGAAVAKAVTGFLANMGLKKNENGTFTFKPKGGQAEVTSDPALPQGPAALDAGRVFGGKVMSVVPGLAPVAVGLAFYAKSQESSDGAQVWLASSGLGMIGYGIGYVVKAILERVDVDYASAPNANGSYAMKTPASTWASKTAAFLPLGAVDTYESNIVINGLGYAGGVRGYMRAGRMNGLGYSRNPGAPTFVQRLNSAPTEIQTLAGVSAAPMTSEVVSLQGLSATLM